MPHQLCCMSTRGRKGSTASILTAQRTCHCIAYLKQASPERLAAPPLLALPLLAAPPLLGPAPAAGRAAECGLLNTAQAPSSYSSPDSSAW